MAADGPVSQELKTRQEELSTSKKERAAAAAAAMPESTEGQPDANDFIPASVVLEQLRHDAPPGYFTLDWLMSKLQKQSFGLLMLVLAIVAAAPGICLIGGLLLLIPAFQMIMGRPAPTFPRWIGARRFPTRHLGPVVQRAIAVLKYLEKTIHPRGRIPGEASKRVVGIVVVLLSARLIITPIPLSNILPAVVIALISLAYTEEDGLMLSICLLAGFVIVAIDLAVVWQIMSGA
jgi:hypothetical protein